MSDSEMEPDVPDGEEDFQEVTGRRKRPRQETPLTSPSTSSPAPSRPATPRPATPPPRPATPPPRKERVPPIVLHSVKDWQPVIKRLRLKGSSFSAKFVGERLHLSCNSVDCFRIAQRELTALKIGFHTFSLKGEQELKTVIRGLPAWTEPDEIKQDLEDLGYTPTHIAALLRRDKEGSHGTNSFLVRFRKTGTWTAIWKLERLLGVRVTVSEFEPRNKVPQCWNCQNFGHGSATCHLKPRCPRCGEEHLKRDCKQQEDVKAKCANCGGEHSSAWRGCEAAKKALKARTTRPAARPQPQPRTAQRPAPRRAIDLEAEPALRPEQPAPQRAQPEHSAEEGTSFADVTRRRHRQPRKKENRPSGRQQPARPQRQQPEEPRQPAPAPAQPSQTAPAPAPTCESSGIGTDTTGEKVEVSPPATFISAQDIVMWIGKLIPLILSGANQTPQQLIAAILLSIQELLSNG